jgi:hypothetical protein
VRHSSVAVCADPSGPSRRTQRICNASETFAGTTRETESRGTKGLRRPDSCGCSGPVPREQESLPQQHSRPRRPRMVFGLFPRRSTSSEAGRPLRAHGEVRSACSDRWGRRATPTEGHARQSMKMRLHLPRRISSAPFGSRCPHLARLKLGIAAPTAGSAWLSRSCLPLLQQF